MELVVPNAAAIETDTECVNARLYGDQLAS